MVNDRLIVFGILFAYVSMVVGQLLPSPRIKLSHGGILRGTNINSVRGRIIETFLGIPYAEPPKGPLRFAAPRPKIWIGERDAKTKAEPCPQIYIYGSSDQPFGNEDCLYLNVYTPRDRPKTASLPVMVFIHPGAFQMESSDPAIYGPERIVDNDVILVTFNYRLGVFGFLSTGTIDSPGNYGLKDQNLVLHWVQDNIRAFGGNPDKVTLFGQSAGAGSVSLHMASPASRGLFSKAILQSGTYFNPWCLANKDRAVSQTKEVARYAGCPHHVFVDMIDCLRNVPAAKLIWIQQKLFVFHKDPIIHMGPVVEPRVGRPFLAEDPRDMIETHGLSIPIIIGTTSGEGALKAAEAINQHSIELRRSFDAVLPSILFYDDVPSGVQAKITDKIENYYFKAGLDWSRERYQNITQMFGDRLSYAGVDQFIHQRFGSQNRHVGDTYVYLFDHNGPRSVTESVGGGRAYYGVSHFDDLQFLFPYGNLGAESQKRDTQMYWAMPQMWTDFAKTGDPTPSGSLVRHKWERATKYPLKYAKIGNEYFSSHANLQPGLHRRHDVNQVRKHGDNIKQTTESWQTTDYYAGVTQKGNRLSPYVGPLYQNRHVENDSLRPVVVVNDFENADDDYPEIVARNNTAFRNNDPDGLYRSMRGKSKRRRTGRAHHCRSHKSYCKIIRNKHGDFWNAEAAYLYYYS